MKSTQHKQRGATMFEAALGGAVALVIGVIVIGNFKDAKSSLNQVEAAMAMTVPSVYRALPQANDGSKAEAVACDLRVQGSCSP